MKIEKLRDGKNLTVQLEGRLASDTADDLTEALEGEDLGSLEALTFDMQNVDFISSKGIRVLVASQKQLPQGVQLTVAHANAPVLEVLKLSGLTKFFNIAE